MRILVGIALSLVFVFTLMFLTAESQGWTDSHFVKSHLAALRDSSGGEALVGACILLLLVADLFLPVPSSIVMTLSGYFLGWINGALVSFGGAMGGAVLGFMLCRSFGRRAFQRMIGQGDVSRISALLDRYGSWAIILSRSVPMLTEVMSCLAGLSTMSLRRFVALTAAGTLPVCIVYAWAGARTGDTTGMGWAVLLAFVIPAVGFGTVRLTEKRGIRQ